VHACKYELCRKVENEKIGSHTHKAPDMLHGKPFQEKSQLESEVALLPFYV